MNEQLKACPFCGGTDLMFTGSVDLSGIENGSDVCCSDCDGSMHGATKEDAIAAWNTRPIEDAQATQIEKLTRENAHLRDSGCSFCQGEREVWAAQMVEMREALKWLLIASSLSDGTVRTTRDTAHYMAARATAKKYGGSNE